MDEVTQPCIITAIADAEFEGMVSKALFESGWNVVARPLDFATLEKILNEEKSEVSLVIYSVDLPGIEVEKLESLARKQISLIGFVDGAQSPRGFENLTSRPNTAEELMAYIRANMRSPLLRAPLLQSKPNIQAKIIAVGSAGSNTGATTLALNLAYELSQLEMKTLLIDANFQSIAVATLLDLHKLADEDKWRDLSDNFSVSEVTQRNIMDFPARALEAAEYFDYIVIDLGSLQNLASDLSDRRWLSQVKIWASRFAQDLYLCSGSDHLQIKRLKKISLELSQVKIPARISVFIKPIEVAIKKRESRPLDLTPLTPRRINYLPQDLKHCSMAREGRTTLTEINAKAPLRKAIAAIAQQITE
jgi:hypothetical protein